MGTLTMAVLPARPGSPSVLVDTAFPVRWSFGEEGLGQPVADALSVQVLDRRSGSLAMPLVPYVHNSFGAAQGGVMALLAELSGLAAVEAAGGGRAAGAVPPWRPPSCRSPTWLSAASDPSRRGPTSWPRRTRRQSGRRAHRRGSGGSGHDGGPCRCAARGDPIRRRPDGRSPRVADGRPAPACGRLLPHRAVGGADSAPGVEAPPAMGGACPVDDHLRGAGGGLPTGGLITVLDSAGRAVERARRSAPLDRDHQHDGHRRRAVPPWSVAHGRPGRCARGAIRSSRACAVVDEGSATGRWRPPS